MPKYKLLVNTGRPARNIDEMIEEWIEENTVVEKYVKTMDIVSKPTIMRLHYQMATIPLKDYTEIVHSVLIEYK